MDMQYIYTAGQNNGRIVQAIDGVAGETVNYTYDALNRLATAGATNGTWGQAFAYDGFGNLTGKTVTQGSAPTLSVSFDPLTNHQNGQSYDANGNPASMYLKYDIENRMIVGANGDRYAYDHAGKRVKKAVTGAEEFYFYGINGKRLATLVCTGEDDGTGCQPRMYDVYFGGKLVRSRGALVATDRLGSVRASSTGDRMTYYPYGEERTSTADGRDKFGTYMRDSVTQDYADQRYYAVGMGRFNTVDPSGIATVDPMDPRSWNRFGYAGGDPITFNDPRGLNYMCDAEYESCDDSIGGVTMVPYSGGGGGSQDAMLAGLNQYFQGLGFSGAVAIPLGQGLGTLVCMGSGVCEVVAIGAGVGAAVWGSWQLGKWIGGLIFATNVKDSGIVKDMYEAYGNDVDPCDALEDMLAQAKADDDTARVERIKTTQKGFGCRNKAKGRR
jgi:RHS repeat-associated protein